DYFLPNTTQEDLVLTFRQLTNFYVLSNTEQSGYEIMGDSVMNKKEAHYQVYRKVLDAVAVVQVAQNVDAELVVVQQQSGLQPAFDLKESTSYKAYQSTRYKEMQQVHFQKGERLQYTSNDRWMEFEIKVGVADVYALMLKYHNASKQTREATIELITMDDVVLKS